jgi:hypothetical protein
MVRWPTRSRVQGAHIAAGALLSASNATPHGSLAIASKLRRLDSKPRISHSADRRQAGGMLVDFGVDLGPFLFEKKEFCQDDCQKSLMNVGLGSGNSRHEGHGRRLEGLLRPL